MYFLFFKKLFCAFKPSPNSHKREYPSSNAINKSHGYAQQVGSHWDTI